MTDDQTRWCVRGCTDPPGRAACGLLCELCSDRLLQAVTDLPGLWSDLPSIYDTHTAGAGERIKRGRLPGSPSLIRLDVMVLEGARGSYAGDGVMPVRQTLGGWLLILGEELGLRPASEAMADIGTLLRVHHDRICRQPWVGEYWADMIGIWRALRHATGAPGPLGRCWGRIANLPNGGCGRVLWPPPAGVTQVTCPNGRCGRTYSGPDLVKLAIQAERDGLLA